MKRTIYLSYLLAAIALLAWALVIYAGFAIDSTALGEAQTIAAQQQQSDQAGYQDRIHSLAAQTTLQRLQLGTLTSTDVVTIVTLLETTGKSVGAKVSTALPEGGSVTLPGGGVLQPIAFVVDASGSFSSLMHALALYETLPIPSQVEQVDLEYVTTTPGASAGSWHLTAHVRVLTSADISS